MGLPAAGVVLALGEVVVEGVAPSVVTRVPPWLSEAVPKTAGRHWPTDSHDCLRLLVGDSGSGSGSLSTSRGASLLVLAGVRS